MMTAGWKEHDLGSLEIGPYTQSDSQSCRSRYSSDLSQLSIAVRQIIAMIYLKVVSYVTGPLTQAQVGALL